MKKAFVLVVFGLIFALSCSEETTLKQENHGSGQERIWTSSSSENNSSSMLLQRETTQDPSPQRKRWLVIEGTGLSTKLIPIKEELDVIIELSREPLISLQKRLKGFYSKGETKGMLVEHLKKLTADLKEIKDFILREDNKHSGKFKEFKRTFSGLATRLKRKVIDKLRSHPKVKKIHPDPEVKIILEDSIPLLGVDEFWKTYGAKGEGMEVAVIDTGIDYMHTDLGGGFGDGYKVVKGYDFHNDDPDPMDDHGHGTHVAGIIAANGSIVGVAPEAKLHAYKVLSEKGLGYGSTVISGIERAVDPDQDPSTDDAVDVMNLSLGGPGYPDDPLSCAIDNATDAGVICVVAAGNSSGYFTIGSPACARKALTVGASDKSDVIASFSSRGPTQQVYLLKPDLLAPGVSIKSTFLSNSYLSASGTSMAAPHAAGIAALLKQIKPGWDPITIKCALAENALDLGYDALTQGSGRIDILNSADTLAIIYPNNFWLGFVNLDQEVWKKTQMLTITNLSNQKVSYDFEVSTLGSGITCYFDPSTVSLSAGESKEVMFTVEVDNSICPFPTTPYSGYLGEIKAISASETLKVPFGFFKAHTLKVTFLDEIPTSFLLHNRDSWVGVYFPSSNPFYVMLPGYKEYDLLALLGNREIFIVKEIYVPDDVEIVEVTLSKNDAIHELTYKQLDKDGNELPYDKLVTLDGKLHTTPFNSYFHFLYISPTGGMRIGCSILGQQSNVKRFTTLSTNYKLEFYTHGFSEYTGWALYEFGYPQKQGISASEIIYNNPLDFRHIIYKYHLDPSVSEILIQDEWIFWGWQGGKRTPLLIADLPLLKVFTTPFVREAYLLPFSIQDSFELSRGFYISKYEGDFFTESELLNVQKWTYYPKPDQVDIIQGFGLPPLISFTSKKGKMDVGLGPAWFTGKIAFDNKEKLLLPLIWKYKFPVYKEEKSCFVNQWGDISTYKLPYELYKDGVLLEKGENFPGEIEISPFGIGNYRLNLFYDNYWVNGSQGKVIYSFNFDYTGGSSDTPPYLYKLNILGEGEINNIFSEKAQLKFIAADNQGLRKLSAYYDDGNDWKEFYSESFYLLKQKEFLIELPTDEIQNNAFVNLRLLVEDTSGNYTIYEAYPAFYKKYQTVKLILQLDEDPSKTHYYYQSPYKAQEKISVKVCNEEGVPITGLTSGAFTTELNGGLIKIDYIETTPGLYEGFLAIGELQMGYHKLKVSVSKDGILLGSSLRTLSVAGTGDVIMDGKVDIYDVTRVSASYGAKFGDKNWCGDCDLTYDNEIDIYDVVIVNGAYGSTYKYQKHY
jgi:hypothetical protein